MREQFEALKVQISRCIQHIAADLRSTDAKIAKYLMMSKVLLKNQHQFLEHVIERLHPTTDKQRQITSYVVGLASKTVNVYALADVIDRSNRDLQLKCTDLLAVNMGNVQLHLFCGVPATNAVSCASSSSSLATTPLEQMPLEVVSELIIELHTQLQLTFASLNLYAEHIQNINYNLATILSWIDQKLQPSETKVEYAQYASLMQRSVARLNAESAQLQQLRTACMLQLQSYNQLIGAFEREHVLVNTDEDMIHKLMLGDIQEDMSDLSDWEALDSTSHGNPVKPSNRYTS